MAKNIDEIISYTPAELRVGKETYVSLYAYDPLTNKLKRKRYKLNHIISYLQQSGNDTGVSFASV